MCYKPLMLFFWKKMVDIYLNKALNNLSTSALGSIMPSGIYSYYNYDPEEIFLNSEIFSMLIAQ